MVGILVAVEGAVTVAVDQVRVEAQGHLHGVGESVPVAVRAQGVCRRERSCG